MKNKGIIPHWPAPPGIRAFTTTKLMPCTEDLAEFKAVAKNQLSLPQEPSWLKQTHSNTVIDLDNSVERIGDASFTRENKQVCTILTADCLPILICHMDKPLVSAIHAGWRGLKSGIIENTLQHLNTNPKKLLVWLGPAISQLHYEVGADVYEAFISENSAFKSVFTIKNKDKWFFSISDLATLRLKNCGIHSIFNSNYCTYANADLFYSYRRDHDQGKKGRMATFIWLE